MKLYGIYIFGLPSSAAARQRKDDWLRHGKTAAAPILAFEDEQRAQAWASCEYGYDTYDEAKAEGWCEVRPL